MDFDEQINQHLLWRSMIESLFNEDSKGYALPAVISNDRHCHLGKWIYSKEAAPLTEHASFKKIVEVHKQFHHTAAEIITLFQQNEQPAAEEKAKEFYQLSDAVVDCLNDLKQSSV